MTQPSFETILFASAHASVHFARRCLEPINGNLRSRSTFVDPLGNIMHWHDFGDLEGPGWAANAVGGAVLLHSWGSYVKDEAIRKDALGLVDHILEDGFIRSDGFIWPYYELARQEFCLNYTHNNSWLCPGSLARIGSQMLEFAALIPGNPRANRLQHAALGLANWLQAHTPLLPDGWVPRRITLDGELYPHSPTGGPDPIFDHSADGLYLLHLYAALAALGYAQFRQAALKLGDVFVSKGGYWGSINHDTYDDHESVAYACAYRILREAAGWLKQPAWKEFAERVALPALDRFRMAENRQGVATKGLLWMEETWDTAYLWENAEAAQAALEHWVDTGSETSKQAGLATLRAIANHHYGPYGFLTEGVDWNNHVSQRHHVDNHLYGAINYTEPLLNNLHLVGPTLFYLAQIVLAPPPLVDNAAAVALVNQLSAETAPPVPGKDGVRYFLRLYYPALETDARVEQALAFACAAGVDGVLLFEASYDMDPALLTLQVLQERFARLQDVAPRFRTRGFDVQINMMITIGHVDAGCARPERFPFQFLVNANGEVSRAAACPLDGAFLDHVRAQFRLAAECQPSAIWVDDDTRYLFHDLSGLTCFCPLHLNKVSEVTSRTWTPHELSAAIVQDVSIRAAWMDVQEQAMLDYAHAIEQSVHRVNPDIRIGLMTVGTSIHSAEGRRTDKLLRTLAGTTRPMIRPGSGFWSDWTPANVLDKTEDGARQVSCLGADVQAFAEVENHPYNAFCKSERVLGLELALNILAGMPDLSLNLLTSMGGTGPLEPEDTDFASFLRKQRPFFDALAKEWAGRKRQGIGFMWSEDTARKAQWQISSAGQPTDFIEPHPWEPVLARLGFPIGHPAKGPHWITGEAARALSGYELDQCLREGAVFDPIAAQVALARGLGSRLGLRAVLPAGDAVNEVLSDSNLNGKRGGQILPIYNHIPYQDLFTFDLSNPEAEVLSRWVNVDGDDRGPAAVLLKTADGLPVALLPFHLRAPAPVLLHPAHRVQWAAIIQRVAGKPLPCRITHAANLYPLCFHQPADSSWLIAVANLSADDAVDVKVELAFSPQTIERLMENGSWQREENLTINVAAYSLAAWRITSQ